MNGALGCPEKQALPARRAGELRVPGVELHGRGPRHLPLLRPWGGILSEPTASLSRAKSREGRGASRSVVLGLLMLWIAPVHAVTTTADEAPVATTFQYDAKERRDPFVPLVKNGRFLAVRARALGDGNCPPLRGILWDAGGRSLALLGDNEVRVGEVVEGCEVLEIRRDAVVLSNGTEQVVVQLTFEVPPAKEATGGDEP